MSAPYREALASSGIPEEDHGYLTTNAQRAVNMCGGLFGSNVRSEIAYYKRVGREKYIAEFQAARETYAFWATGDHYPSLIREQLNDYLLVAAAIEREWEGDER